MYYYGYVSGTDQIKKLNIVYLVTGYYNKASDANKNLIGYINTKYPRLLKYNHGVIALNKKYSIPPKKVIIHKLSGKTKYPSNNINNTFI